LLFLVIFWLLKVLWVLTKKDKLSQYMVGKYPTAYSFLAN